MHLSLSLLLFGRWRISHQNGGIWVNSAAWFRDYWLSQRQGEDGFYGNVEDDVAALLPDSIDLGIDEEFLSMEAQFEEFIQSSETGNAYRSSFTTIKGGPENGEEH